MDYILIGVGLAGLYFGAEWLVRGAVATAYRFGISPLIASLVIVGFGTSLPELLVSVRAALSGAPGLALGNVVGSNIANILLIVGLSAVIFPIGGWDKSVRRDAVVLVLSSAVLFLLVQMAVISRVDGLMLLGMLALYLIITYYKARTARHDAEDLPHEQLSPFIMTLLILGGLATLLIGAEALIRGATTLASHLGVSDAVIGLTVVAIGTSLPELATAIVAAMKRHSDVTIGNVTGSCIFNTFCIVGATAAIKPLPVDPGFAAIDVPMMLAASVFFAAMLIFTRKFNRATGVIMLGVYAFYIGFLV
ncbi:calcium/sodium antiporter [Martelella alba]|uniref:Calcium/sodium antiporter n=1 Tax=Martelella alba TaxID=2590451 RepID=A0A506UJA4_9HYPH|nr:calcium/sodium antiporter [Martelella alba]TPW33407.1 calcium/sodium antiporter [Martelella alba]